MLTLNGSLALLVAGWYEPIRDMGKIEQKHRWLKAREEW